MVIFLPLEHHSKITLLDDRSISVSAAYHESLFLNAMVRSKLRTSLRCNHYATDQGTLQNYTVTKTEFSADETIVHYIAYVLAINMTSTPAGHLLPAKEQQ